MFSDCGGREEYLQLPCEKELKNCFRAFRKATSNAAFVMHTCIICGRETMEKDCEFCYG